MVEHKYSSCQFQTSKNNQKQLLQYGLWFGQAAQVSSFFFFRVYVLRVSGTEQISVFCQLPWIETRILSAICF